MNREREEENKTKENIKVDNDRRDLNNNSNSFIQFRSFLCFIREHFLSM